MKPEDLDIELIGRFVSQWAEGASQPDASMAERNRLLVIACYLHGWGDLCADGRRIKPSRLPCEWLADLAAWWGEKEKPRPPLRIV